MNILEEIREKLESHAKSCTCDDITVQMGYEKYRELLREASKLQRVITKSETMSKNFDGGITEHPITVYGYEIIVNYFGKKQKDELKLICKRRFFHNRRW